MRELFLQVFDRFWTFPWDRLLVRTDAKKLLIDFRVDIAAGDQILTGLQAERHAQRVGDRARDIFLDLEDIGELTVVIFGPDVGAVVGLDELSRYARAVAGFAHRAFD